MAVATAERPRVYTAPSHDAILHLAVPRDKKRCYQEAAQEAGLSLSALTRQALDHEVERMRATQKGAQHV
jgi:hypothetical protein